MRSWMKVLAVGVIACVSATAADEPAGVRARQIGIEPGVLQPGKYNAITDVDGVRVGHVTLKKGDSIRTGATAILPHGGNLFQDKVPAAVVVANGFGKLMGSTQVDELGEIESPIVLTNTLGVPRAAEAIVSWALAYPGNEKVVSVNAVVGETNDSRLNDIRSRPLTAEFIAEAITSARGGAVAEGAVGAGTGTVAFGWKGGIGTSSRVLPKKLGGYTVGVLVQSNFGGILQMDGVPIGEALGQYYLKQELDDSSPDGSIIIVVATDAPLSPGNLRRLGNRALAGLARTGSSFSNGSGDYAISFSTAASVRRTPAARAAVAQIQDLPNDPASPLFQAAIEATEEAIYNSMLMAHSERSFNTIERSWVTVEALPVDRVKEILRAHGRRVP
jgi:D-aminopeptidase